MRVFLLLWCIFLSFPGVVSASVVVNEVYPQPNSGESEWVELFNSSEESVDLSSWELWDELSSASKIYQFTDQLIEAGELLVIELQSVLNNGGDAVVLKDASGQQIDRLSYSSSIKGESWARNPDDLSEIFAANPTQGSANPTPTPSPTPTPTPTPKSSSNDTAQPTQLEATQEATVAGTATEISTIEPFLYPPSVLNPKLDYRENRYPARNNIAFSDPPRLEKGALSVIMGSLFLLIPGWIYVKKKQQHF